MPKARIPASQQAQVQTARSQQPSLQRKRPSTLEDAHMRKITLYFVLGFCSFSELASLAAFFFTRNAEAALIFQLPALAFFYRVLCYLFPTNDASANPLIALVQTIWRHKP